MFEILHWTLPIVLVFVIGYAAIIFEGIVKINKTASALLMAVILWLLFFVGAGHTEAENSEVLAGHLSEITQIVFFLMGAMTLVEIVDSHKGFKIITDLIQTNSKKKMLWVLGIAAFFLSAILDNLTTTIVMISLLRKLIPEKKERMILGAMIVIAANAGGAWTPIGDVTTTMLWINGNLTSISVIQALFFPSLISLAAALFLLGWKLKGSYPKLSARAHAETAEPGARVVFFFGIGALVFVPIFKALTGLPPFMGILIGLGVLWLITDLLHFPFESRQHLRVPHILTRLDTSGVLFFLGILLCVSALDAAGLLREWAYYLDTYVKAPNGIAVLIGLISAVVDNVPLVAAGMKMYDFPTDAGFWQLLAYCAGTGGSILVIGSAAGIALMSLEKVDFMWYLKKASWVALVSYFAGVAAYFVQNWIVA